MAGKIAWIALILAALYFAVQGGEYSTADIVRQSRRVTAVQLRADSLQHTVDSLRRAERAVRTDPVTQERIAREEFGLVRGNEVMYRLIPSTAARPH